MARQIRIEYPGAYYHVMMHGNGFQWIYKNETHLKLFQEIIIEVVKKYKVKIHAVVLMRNHYHLLLETPEGNLNRCMRKLNRDFARLFNNNTNRKGSVFKGRYISILVEKEEYYHALLRYICQNPVRKGIVDKCEKYKGGYINWIRKNSEIKDYLYLDDIKRYFNSRDRWLDNFLEWINDGIESNPQNESKYRNFLGRNEWIMTMREQIERNIRKSTREKKKYYGMKINECKLQKLLMDVPERFKLSINLKIHADYTDLTLLKLSKRMKLKSEAACWQRLYRFRKELEKDKKTQDLYRKIEKELINNVSC